MAFVDLHNHTEYSALDGLSTCAEAVARAASQGAPALAVTDHGHCSAHPDFQAAADKAGIKPIFGMEAYFTPDRHEKVRGSHLILLAQDDAGLKDLWAASTEAYVSGSYFKPRVDWDLLERFGSRLIVTSGCLGGPVSKQIEQRDYDGAEQLMARFKALLGDRFYLEIQPNQLPPQIRLNKILAQAGEAMGIPLVAATDAHYPDASQAELHKLWMACQTGTANDDYWNYIHMFGEDEVRAGLGYLDPRVVDRAIRATVEISERCTARVNGNAAPPVFTRGGTYADDSRLLLNRCLENWHKVPDTQEYRDRLEREWTLVADKHLAGCYLIVDDVISWTRAQGQLVGPGRGSAAGSLMSYLLRITTMDPIPSRLLFERFLTEGRTALPDFDMDFPSSWRPRVTDYVVRRYGEDKVVRVGTTMRYRSKGILNKLFSVMKHGLAPEWFEDHLRIASVIDDAESHTAGLGLPWEDIMEVPELRDFARKYDRVFEAAEQLVGRVNSYGKHPAGLVISTDASLATAWPMRTTEDNNLLIAQWDFRTLESLGLLKLDFLTLRTLDTLQMTIDLVRERTGITLNPADWTAEHEDPQVWEEVGTGNTLGMFQVESSLGRQACREMKPVSIAELGDLVAYIRPGPRNSGLADTYLRRRAGKEEIAYPHPLLEEALRHTQGVMLYQEDLLAACTLLAGYDSGEADQVRKILGKKKTELIAAAGEKFVAGCVERGHDEASVRELWAAMAEFGKYGFNRAHAFAYATLAFWTAWMKTHYPVEYFTAILSTLDDKDRHAAFAMDARRLGVEVLPPDVRYCGANFRSEGLAVRYGLSSVKGVGNAAISGIVGGQPYEDFADFLKRSRANAGVVYALAKAGALDPLVPTRKGLVTVLESIRSGDSTTCVYKDKDANQQGLPCTFRWSDEPVEIRIGARGQELPSKPRPLPKRCSRACRQYHPPAEIDPAAITEYPPEELWAMDQETYGTWMSDAVFAQVGDDGLRAEGRRIAQIAQNGAPGTYSLLAVYGGHRDAVTSGGNPMWWVRLVTEVSEISAVVFTPRNEEPNLGPTLRYVKQGTLIAATLLKDRYYKNGWRTSWRLAGLSPLGGR